MHAIQTDRDCGGYEAITVADSAIGFTQGKIVPGSGSYEGMSAQEVYCTLETAAIRFTIDGTTPTTSVGHLLNTGDTLKLSNPNMIQNFSAIRTASTNGSLKVSYMF